MYQNCKNDVDYIKTLEKSLGNSSLSDKEIAYYKRILRVYNMPNLALEKWNPVNMIVEKVTKSDFFSDFEIFTSPEVVKEFETFDLFYFPENHVARRPSDSYFLQKTSEKEANILLRPHTTIMWYHYLIQSNWIEKLHNTWEIKVLSYWKTYRVDELDKTHHECFHQIDWLRICEKQKEIINQETLKKVLSNMIKALFWDKVEYRFNVDHFPYTIDSLEVEVKFNNKWLEVTWAWVVHPTVLEKLWIDPEKYNGWAFGFGIERLAMIFKNIPDIRIFWSRDKRVLAQWWNFEAYKEISSFPPVYKDISIIVPKEKFIVEEKSSEQIKLNRETESSLFAITWIIRDAWENLVEEVKIIDEYENDKKFWELRKSFTLNITFRSIEKTLTNEEINKIYFEIREKIEKDLGYELR